MGPEADGQKWSHEHGTVQEAIASASQGCGFCSLVVGISDLRSRLISLPKLATDILYLELDGPGRLKAHTSGTSLWGRLKYCPAASEDSCKRLFVRDTSNIAYANFF